MGIINCEVLYSLRTGLQSSPLRQGWTEVGSVRRDHVDSGGITL